MKRKNLDPFGPEVTKLVLENIRRMTPEEALADLQYRTPGVPETDMTGMLAQYEDPEPNPSQANKTQSAAGGSEIVSKTNRSLPS